MATTKPPPDRWKFSPYVKKDINHIGRRQQLVSRYYNRCWDWWASACHKDQRENPPCYFSWLFYLEKHNNTQENFLHRAHGFHPEKKNPTKGFSNVMNKQVNEPLHPLPRPAHAFKGHGTKRRQYNYYWKNSDANMSKAPTMAGRRSKRNSFISPVYNNLYDHNVCLYHWGGKWTVTRICGSRFSPRSLTQAQHFLELSDL